MNPWLMIGLIGLGTYLMRLSFVGLVGARGLPVGVQQVLKYVAPAVFAAIIAPAVILVDGAVTVAPDANPRLLAAVAAGLVAWRSRSVTATIGAGMAILWILQATI